MPNAWRILSTYYIGFKMMGEHPSPNAFKSFCSLKILEGLYIFEPHYGPILVKLVHWQMRMRSYLVRLTIEYGFRVNIFWRIAPKFGNVVPQLSPVDEV